MIPCMNATLPLTHNRRVWRLRRLAAMATILSCALAAPCALALPGPSSAAFDKGALFTVAGYTGSSPLSGFPVLVRIAANSPSGFSYADLHSQTDGADIAFVDMDGNGLPFEIDTWDTSGTSLIWVRLPTMTNGTQFAMCWGADASGKTIYTKIGRHEPLFLVMYKDLDGEWLDERIRELLADDGVGDLYPTLAHV